MIDATGETVTVRLGAVTPRRGRDAEFSTSGTIITDQGFRLAYVADATRATSADDAGAQLPALAEGDALDAHRHRAAGHDTQPPARYTEASLVKRLEELGVGRPSTYASIIKTIQDRGVRVEEGTRRWSRASPRSPSSPCSSSTSPIWSTTRSPPAWRTTSTRSPGAREEMAPWLAEFYFGPTDATGQRATAGSKEQVGDAPRRDRRRGDQRHPASALDPERRARSWPSPVADNGPYVMRGDDTASDPRQTLPPDELTVEKALELLAAAQGRHAARDRPRDRAARLRQERAVRPLRAARRVRRRRATPSRGWPRCSRP